MMVQSYQLTDNEKELLTVLGTHPEMSMKELLNHTSYKWMSTVAKRIEHLKEQRFLYGPIYYVDYGKLCKNPFHRLVCIIELNQSQETVVSYLRLIEPLIWVFPVLSSYTEVLNAGFFSSNDAEVKNLLQMLKDNNVISNFIVRVRRYRNGLENPNLSGDFNPSLDNLLDPCELPDISFGHHDTTWTECDIMTLTYLQGGFRDGKLMDILREERRVHNRIWTYEQIRYSYEKMMKNGLIEKKYAVFPLQFRQCSHFELHLRTEDELLTHRILHNFAKGARVYKEYMLFDEWGMIDCLCHPAFVIDLMHKLDRIDEITEKELYQIRSVQSGIDYFGEYSEFKYYDVETQTLECPYHVYKEKIKEKLESEAY